MTSAALHRGGGKVCRGGLTVMEVLVIVTIVAVLFLAAAAPTFLEWSTGDRTSAATTVRVAPNQTLWSIAEEYRLEGSTTAETVAEIKRLNNLRGSVVNEGSTLRIPITEPSIANAWASR